MAKKTKNNLLAESEKGSGDTSASKKSSKGNFSILGFRVQAIILAVIGFVFYCNTFSNESAFDDRMAIVDNEYVQQGFAGIPSILSKDAYQSYLEHRNGSNQLAGGRYRPLSLITFAIEQQFMGVANDEPGNARETRIAEEMHTRHVVNVVLYILSVIVLLYFLRHVVFPNEPVIAFITALLFTIHPIHTEVVANVKSRDEILSVLFISLTFIKAFRYYDHRKMRDLLLALLYFFLALLSKEYAVTLVVLLPLAFYIFRTEGFAKSIKGTLPYLAPFVIYLLLRYTAVIAMAEGAEQNVMNNPYLFATGAQKTATEIMILLDYLRLLIFPNVLAADYSYNQIPYTGFLNPIVLLSLAVHVALVVAMGVLIAKRHVLGFAIAIYLVNLALVSNVLFNIGAPMGERLIYHSSVGFCMAIAFLVYIGLKRIKQPSIANAGLTGPMVILTALCGFKTIERNKDWKNDETLFMADVKKVPNSVLANNNAAAACMNFAKRNREDVAVRNEWFQKAVAYFDKAIAIYPKHTLSYLNRGLCYFNMGMPDKALPDWDTARKYSPNEQNLPKYLTTAGKYFYDQGRNYTSKNMPDFAIIAYKKCVDATPEIPEAWYSLGISYIAVGKQSDAKHSLGKALQLAPNTPEVQKAWEQVKEAQ